MASLDSEIVDINVYTMQLLRETCPTMDELAMVQVAKNLIEEATVEVNKRDKVRRRLNKRAKLAAQKSKQENHGDCILQKSKEHNTVPIMATNNATVHVRNAGRITYSTENCQNHNHREMNLGHIRNAGISYGTENYQNHHEVNVGHYGNAIRQRSFPIFNQVANFPQFYGQNRYRNGGMMPYNNFNTVPNWINGNYKPIPMYHYPKRKNGMPHETLGSKRMRS